MSRTFGSTAFASLLTVALLIIGGCAAPGERQPVSGSVPPAAEPIPLPETPRRPIPEIPPVAVVLSADTPPYRKVADALPEGRWQHYVLGEGNEEQLRARIRNAGHRRAIAIGRAALALLSATDIQVTYCQIFDAAAADGRRGVAPVPDFGAQLDAWRLRHPAMRRVGLITGPGYDGVANELAQAAEPRALTAQYAVVRSDQEFLYVFRRMVPEIEGFVLYPDTRVLSPVAIREVLGYARKHGVWVLTYNRPVFELGAAILISADPREVARQAVAVLEGRAGSTKEATLSSVVVETAFATGDGG